MADDPWGVVSTDPIPKSVAPSGSKSSDPWAVVSHEPEPRPAPKPPSFPQDEPGYTYGNLLPFRVKQDAQGNDIPGSQQLAVPEAIRAPVRGIMDMGKRMEGPLTPDKMHGLNPDEQAAFLSAGGVRPGVGEMGKVASGLTSPFGAKISAPGRIDASDNAKAAINAGFAIPPAEASEGHIGKVNLTTMAAGEAGKIKLGQLAAAKNQPLVNGYAQRDLGLPPGTLLTPKAFEDVRAREGKVYQEVVDAVPEVDLSRDKAFVDAVKGVGKRSEETERLFPSTTEPPGVTALRDELLANARGDTKAVMNYIADLRFRATQNFQARGNAMAHRQGAAEREAASALEDAMERSVQKAPDYYADKFNDAISGQRAAAKAVTDANMALTTARGTLATNSNIYTAADAMRAERAARSALDQAHEQFTAATDEVEGWRSRLQNAHVKDDQNQTLVDRFRKARQTMAKSYDVQSVTNVSTGDVSATGLGRLLQQGKPLTGDLKLIADSANSFHRAFQNPAAFGGVEPLSVLDAASAAMMAAGGHPVAAMGVLGRPWIRGRVLSPAYQRRMISDPQTHAMPWTLSVLPGAVAGSDGSDETTRGATNGMTK